MSGLRTCGLLRVASLMLLATFIAARAPPGSSTGATVRVPLKTGPPAVAPWVIAGRCYRWDAASAPSMMSKRLATAVCRTASVPSTGYYHVIAQTSEPSNRQLALGVVRMFHGTTLLEWRKYFFLHERGQHSHAPIKHYLRAGTEYTVCFSGRDQTFNLCGIDLYKCQTDNMCETELQSHSLQSLSRRNR